MADSDAQPGDTIEFRGSMKSIVGGLFSFLFVMVIYVQIFTDTSMPEVRL